MLVQSALVALSAAVAGAVPAITIKDNFLYNEQTQTRFQISGVAYQIGGSAGYDPATGTDPLSHPEVCLRDAALMQIMGMNTIRVYNLDPNLNHDECASIFNAAGIYMLIDVNSPLPGEALHATEPWTTYTSSYLNRTFAVVEAFKNYDNTLAFFSGNEVINDEETGELDPAYIRAVTRDLKNYIKKHSKRQIPVGYSAADVRSILFASWQYFQCAIDGEDDNASKADLFALNSYSWCGESSIKEAGYDTLVEGFANSSIPIFFSEYGCNTPSPRVFTEVPAIFSSDMTDAMSGGVVYEYAQEENNYGLVKFGSDGTATLMDDFWTFKARMDNIKWSDVQGVKVTAADDVTPPKCGSDLITVKGFQSNFTLPVLPPGASEIIDNGVSPAPVGKMVDISSWNVTQKVVNSTGNELTGLAVVKIADNEFNTPGSNTANGAAPSTSTSSTGSSPSSSSNSGDNENAAGRSVTAVSGMAMGAVALVAAFAL